MKKVLIIKLAAIGDVVMCLHLGKLLKQKEVKVDWVVGKIASPFVLQENFNRTIIVNEEAILKGKIFARILEIFKLWFKLIFHKYDEIFIAHSDARYKLLILPKIFTSRFKTFHPRKGKNHLTEYISTLLGENISHTYLEKLSQSQKKISQNKKKKVVAIIPGGAKNLLADDWQRRYPLDLYIKLIGLFNQNKCIDVQIHGSKSDDWVLQNLLDANIRFSNYIGKFGLIELKQYIETEIDLFITHDTGPLHIAQSTSTPIISIFGATNPQERYIKNNINSRYFFNPERNSCIPCYDGKTYLDCEHHICMRSIDPQDLYQNALNILSEDEGAETSGRKRLDH